MYGPALTPAVETGLAWFFLLCALLNIGAAAHWVFWSRGRKLFKFEQTLLIAFAAGYALLLLGKWPFHLPIVALYWIGVISNALALFIVLPPSIYKKVTAGLVWGVCAIAFQLLGLLYISGFGFAMPSAIKDAIDWLAGPVTFFFGSSIALALFLYFRQSRVVGGIRIPFGLTDPPVMFGILNFVLLFLGLSMTDYDLRQIVSKPDNVPIPLMLFSVGYFTWLYLRKSVINDQRLAEGKPPVEAEENDKVLVWPDLVYTEMLAMIICTVVLVLWSILLAAPLEEPSNLTKTPNPSKAPWYFLGLQEMLVYYDPWLAGVVFPTLIIVGLMAIPYIDFNKAGNGYFTFNQRAFGVVTFMFGFIILWVLMVMLGTFLRGPGWNFFGPYQYWDPHLVRPLNNVDLPEFFWINWLGVGKPTKWYVRELPGFVLVILYFAILPPLMARTVFRDFFNKMGFARYMVFASLVLLMAALPIKMVLRWSFNLKYLIHIDEFFFNV
jgi:Cytochrome b(C-terminal)/b6/petD